jgi:hypothetical protein
MSGYSQPPNPTTLTDLHKTELDAAGIPTSMDKSQPTTSVSQTNVTNRRGHPLTPPQSPTQATYQRQQQQTQQQLEQQRPLNPDGHIHFNNAGENAGNYSNVSEVDHHGDHASSQPADVQPPSHDEPTFSHAIAADHNPSKVDPSMGAEGLDGQTVAIHHKDIGSNRGNTKADSEGVWSDPAEVVHGKMTKEDFWVLVRRFNKVSVEY